MTTYNLYWDTVSPVTLLSNQIIGVVNPYHHTGLTNGTTYYYAVTANDINGESALSNEVALTPSDSILPTLGYGPPANGSTITRHTGKGAYQKSRDAASLVSLMMINELLEKGEIPNE